MDRIPARPRDSRKGSRRSFLGAAVFLLPAFLRHSRAQPPARVHRIAFVNPQPGDPEVFRERMSELGFAERRDIEMRLFPIPSYPDLEEHVRPAVAWKPDIVIVDGSDIRRVRQAVPGSIPVVFTRSNDPVSQGLVESLARPGGNTTGVSGSLEGGKWLEIASKLVPGKTRFVCLVDKSTWLKNERRLSMWLQGAERLKVNVTEIDVSRFPGGVRDALDSLLQGAFDALLTFGFHSQAKHAPASAYAAFQRRTRIPCIMQSERSAEQGVVMSRSPDWREQQRLAAELAARILQGGRAGELPVMRSTRYRIVINRRVATEIGLKIPPDLLLLADRVID